MYSILPCLLIAEWVILLRARMTVAKFLWEVLKMASKPESHKEHDLSAHHSWSHTGTTTTTAIFPFVSEVTTTA